MLVPYRPDSIHRERIYETTSLMWSQMDVEVVHCDDGLDGLFSYARASNRARAKTNADCLLMYSVDAVPLPAEALAGIEDALSSGLPWTTVFTGQRRFTAEQTEALIAGYDPGQPSGEFCEGREALLGVRSDVWDDLRGMDERFVGWGPEDKAWHQVLKTIHPDGNDQPEHGMFHSLWHPPTSRAALDDNSRLWLSYQPHDTAAAMREFYLSRP